MNNRLKKLFSASPLKLGLLITACIVLLYFVDFSFLRFMELKALDLRMVSRGVRAPGGQTVIAAVDEKSVNELGRWPWPRATVARLLDKLKQYGALSVGFDIFFSEPSNEAWIRSIDEISRAARQSALADKKLSGILDQKRKIADGDSELARAVAESGNVTLGYFFHTARKEAGHLTQAEIDAGMDRIAASKYPVVQIQGTPDLSRLISAFAAVPNIAGISDSARNSGYANAFPDSDGVLRRAPLVIRFGEDLYPSLALSLLVQSLDGPMLAAGLSEIGVSGIRIGDRGIPTDESGRMLINYLGPGNTFPHYSVSDILSGRIEPELLKDKIVLVGATAAGIYDLRVTPFSTVYPGVEVHATVIDNILHGDFIRRPGWAGLLDVTTVLLFGLAMSFILPRFRALQSFLLVLAVLALYVAGNILLFSRYNLWLDIVYPVLTIVIVYLGLTVYKYMTEEREKKKIRNAFQYYLSSPVINEMLKNPGKLKLGGDKKDLSVLFSDIRGFTTMSEGMSPEALVQLLNEYLTAMTNIVFKHDGLLDKYMGDAIMAVFGAPLDQPDHAVRACRTALDMMEEMHKFQAKWKAEGKPVFDIGIGINSGDMVVGNMGSEMRFDYTVMGDNVNLGSRLEGINKEYGTNIVISEFTYAHIKNDFICRELDSVKVKGKHLPVRIYELLEQGKAADADTRYAFLKVFNEGLVKYKLGLWDEAASSFRRVLQMRPEDRPSELYVRRCKELKENPPEGEWDGVYTMTKK